MGTNLTGTMLAFLNATVWLPPQIGQLLFFSVLGLFAGGIRSAQRPSPRPPLGDALRDVISKAAGGALSAFAAGAVCLQYWGPDRLYVELVVAVLAGWLGTGLIDAAASAAFRGVNNRLQRDADQPKKEGPP